MWLVFVVKTDAVVQKILLEFHGDDTMSEVRSTFLESIGAPNTTECTFYYNTIPLKAGTQQLSRIRDICEMAEISAVFNRQSAGGHAPWTSGGGGAAQSSQFQSLTEGFGRADRAALERLKRTGRDLNEIIAAYVRLDRDEVRTRAELEQERTNEEKPGEAH
jgi:hypothetical protein